MRAIWLGCVSKGKSGFMQRLEDYAHERTMSVEDRCAVELGLLERFDAFARAHGLRYWLFWGTLLGAVRHKGFIPWDDDIDIAMPQEDYLRLIELMRARPDAIENARLNAYELDGGYTRPFAKLCDTRTVLFESFDLSYVEEGVYLDVFPLLPAPDTDSERARLRREWRKNFVLLGLSKGPLVRTGNLVIDAAKVLLKPYATARGYEAFLSSICSHVDVAERDFFSADMVVSVEESVSFFEARWFAETEFIPFEHLFLPAPKDSDAILCSFYGDYMQLPPESERVRHKSVAYWKRDQA